MAVPVALIAALISGGIKLISGAKQQKEARKLARENARPNYEGTDMYEDLLDFMTNQAQFGLDKNALTFAEEANARALTAGLNTSLQSGGTPNDIGNMYSQFTDSLNQLAIADSDKRYQKVGAIAGTVDRIAGGSRDEFLYNRDAPFKDTAQLAAAKQNAGYQEFMGGLDTIFSSIIDRYAGNGYDSKDPGEREKLRQEREEIRARKAARRNEANQFRK